MKKNGYRKSIPKLNRILLWSITIVLVGGVGTVIFSQNKKMPNGKTQDEKTYIPTLAITRDSKTGEIRKPTPAETKELVASLKEMTNRSSRDLKEQKLPNGAVMVNLEGRFAPVMLAKPKADGSTEMRCVTNFQEALDFLGLVEKGSDDE